MNLETPRLILREFRADDFAALFEMESRPETARFEPERSADDVRKYLEDAALQALAQPRIHYRFAVTIRPDDCAGGLVGIARNIEMTRDWEIGWMVHPDAWGQGYASEAARRVVDFAFKELDAHRVVAFCDVENRASERVMQKLGMRHEATMRQTRLLRGEWRDELLYAILESEWAQSMG
jgi:RimJ/RimL family protein N-acetyltransferase